VDNKDAFDRFEESRGYEDGAMEMLGYAIVAIAGLLAVVTVAILASFAW
jgi:hypothetical protein